jgi:predicted small lipoprotein YifL
MKPAPRTTAIVLSCALALLAGCGQKGPLVLPGYPKEATWPYPARPGPTKPGEQRKAPDVPASSDNTK